MTTDEGAAQVAAPGRLAAPEDQDHAAPAAGGGALGQPSPENVACADGVEYVNRAGVAELARRSVAWVERAARKGQRASTGFPDPVPGVAPAGDGPGRPQEWYPLAGVRAWLGERTAAMPQPQRVAAPDDPDELIDAERFRTEVMRPVPSRNTFKGLLGRLRVALRTGQPGPLPTPDEWVSGSPRWRRATAVAWQNQRPGSSRGGRLPAGARPPLPASEPEDPDELIGETRFRTEIVRPPMSQSRWRRLRALSLPEWEAGRDGMLPRPDAEGQVRTGRGTSTVYRWRAARVAAWQNEQVREHRQRYGERSEPM